MNATESSKAYSKIFVFGMHMVRVAHVTTTLGALIRVPSLRLVSPDESMKVHILDIKGSKSVKLLTDAVSFGFGDPFKTAQSTSTVLSWLSRWYYPSTRRNILHSRVS